LFNINIDSENLTHDDLNKQQLAPSAGEGAADMAGHGLNDIKVVHHPSAGRETEIYTFKYYCNAPDAEQPTLTLSVAESMPSDSDKHPWHPFPTRTDFKLAEVILDRHLNRQQIDRILAIFWKATPPEDNPDISDDRLTIQNSADWSHIWDHALKA
ncbi:hypothetical protein HYPSUDRAFT_1071042, partial [Hypholoma sublateritium FD-334 SS-4]